MTGAIFDVDGTLLDSMGVWYGVTEQYFDENGRILSPETGALFQDMTLSESTAYMHDVIGFSQSPERIAADLERMIAKEYEENIPLKPYAEKYLRALQERGVQLAVATSGYAHLWRAAFERLGILQFFKTCAFSHEVGVNKSNPDVYLLAAQRLGVEPSECTVYEDILAGIVGAKKAGMHTVGVYDASNGADAREIMRRADRYIESYAELL